jgi:uncharacterized membrane protein YhhN
MADVACLALGNTQAHNFLKPVLLLLLFAALWQHNKGLKLYNHTLIGTGFLLSWLGDVLLIFESKSPLFFIFGLVSFLLAHIMYIIYFTKYIHFGSLLLKQKLLPAIPAFVFSIILVSFLWPKLGPMKLPVLAYAAVITTMLYSSIIATWFIKKPSGLLFLAGALFFVLSDSLLAINKFNAPFAYAGPAIMLTYCIAQYLICKAAIVNSTVKS